MYAYTIPQVLPHPTLLYAPRQSDNGTPVDCDMLVAHETVGKFPGDLNWLTGSMVVSVNWYISRTGLIYRLDAVNATAHAGRAIWEGRGPNDSFRSGWGLFNGVSEGFECEGPNDGTPMPQVQQDALLNLMAWRADVNKVPPDRVVRHVDISGATEGKTDPRGLPWAAFLQRLYPDHLAIKAAPRCTLDAFKALLAKYNSPALPEADAIYAGIAKMGIDPAVVLAFFVHESACGTQTSIPGLLAQHNWGNLRQGDGREIGHSNGFAVYTNWTQGALDCAQHLGVTYWQVYGAGTIERIVPIYAPVQDKNNPDMYIDKVKEIVAGLAGSVVPDPGTGNSTGYAATLGGANGALWHCDTGFRDFYDEHGGLLIFGFPLADEYYAKDQDGEQCAYLACENVVLKYKPSLPESWRLRPILLTEAVAMRLAAPGA